MKPETKFYAQVKKKFKKFSLIRLENLSLPGTPDLLVYNNNGHFFTLELKVTKTNNGTIPNVSLLFVWEPGQYSHTWFWCRTTVSTSCPRRLPPLRHTLSPCYRSM